MIIVGSSHTIQAGSKWTFTTKKAVLVAIYAPIILEMCKMSRYEFSFLRIFRYLSRSVITNVPKISPKTNNTIFNENIMKPTVIKPIKSKNQSKIRGLRSFLLIDIKPV